ncbi:MULTISPECIES: hypothetical protein [unclassified Pseudomonas]|uniref:hypothetical protein n=1 Tax=unclassified Pseudomonas TaxID=196821 RepID=UPI0002A23C14|nr:MULTISPECIES: hypothetical protein [unclassified Pseudomonas]MBB1606106.1 hypothetical protein [Pseudomonas sp. UMC76]MBB1636579.1 hypothetical protein [Pseudomonas sp. UME83]UNY91363.1 hypothetical protein MRY70_11370 [Pseudomonas sp. M1]
MKKIRALALLSSFAMCVVAADTVLAGTYEWTRGYAQGVEEHFVDDGNGNELNIACPGDGEGAVSAYATIAGRQYSSNDDIGFDVIVDGTTYSNPFFTDCHVCGANFPGFWAALRKANNLQVSAEGKTVKLPTKNLSQVLLPLNSKKNLCRSAW